jgi:hypothetical protein
MTGKANIALGPRDEEGSGKNDPSKRSKIHVGAIHHIEGTCFEEQVVEPVNICIAGSTDVDAGRDRAPQIELVMHLDTGFGASEMSPREETEREIDRGGSDLRENTCRRQPAGRGEAEVIQSLNHVLQFQSEILSGIENMRLAHESFGQVFPEPPVPLLVGIGQGGLGNSFSKTKMVENFASCVETGGDLAQSFPPGQLRKGHADQMLSTPKMPNLALGIVALDQTGKRLAIYQFEDLGEDVEASVHGRVSSKNVAQSSNAWHPFWIANHSS